MQNIDAELDAIYRRYDLLAKNSQWEIIDDLLDKVDVKLTESDILIGHLTATLPMRTKLLNRNSFGKKCLEEFDKRHSEAKELVKGLLFFD